MIFQALFSIFIDISLIALAISLVVREERSLSKALRKIGFNRIGLASLFKKTGKILVLLLVLSIGIYLILDVLNLNDLELVSQALEESKAVLPLFFWLIMLRVISEEVFFRGLLVNKIGVFGSTIVFALLHIGYGSFAEIIGVFALGLVLAKAYQLNKNLYPNILAHALYNAMAMLSLF